MRDDVLFTGWNTAALLHKQESEVHVEQRH